MPEHKQQIWLRPDQVDLVVTMLQIAHQGLETRTVYDVKDAACRFSQRRIKEVLSLLEPTAKASPQLGLIKGTGDAG